MPSSQDTPTSKDSSMSKKWTLDEDCGLVQAHDYLEGDLNWHGNGARSDFARVRNLTKSGMIDQIRAFLRIEAALERAWVMEYGTLRAQKTILANEAASERLRALDNAAAKHGGAA